MSANLVNLNTNPCKMCMPMGSVSAFYGISKSMSILHGSQGCSTYIRRHMATHYNEPVDIASSSLTEEGTVFGGTKNLLKGLENLIKLYNPEVIGVSTTCLAETIGEDVPAIIKQFKDEHPEVTAFFERMTFLPLEHITAMVPPLTPGIMLATPTIAPNITNLTMSIPSLSQTSF